VLKIFSEVLCCLFTAVKIFLYFLPPYEPSGAEIKYIQSVPSSSLTDEEERSYKHMSGSEWVWSVTAFSNKYLNLATFVLATDNTRSQFNDCCFLIVYQVTVRYRYSKWPSSESVHEWTRLIMDCHTL
jgi:hypothetical protein